MRCSALPLATKCRGSYKLTKSYGSVQSRVGQAFHEAARTKVLGIAFDKDSLRTRFGLTDAEMKDIDYGIYNITIRIPEGALVIADDKELCALEGKLTGTMDLGIYYNEILTIADWKSGWGDVEDPETNNQLISYGILGLEAIRAAGKIVKRIDLMIIQPKLNQVKAYSYTPEKLMERAEDIRRIIKESEEEEGEFTTGPWCNSCFKNMNCPAFAGQIQSLALLVEPTLIKVPNVEAALKKMLPFVKACATVQKKVEALAKAWVDANGPLDLGAGQMYVRKVEDKQEIKAQKAFEVLTSFFGDEGTWKLYAVSMEKIIELAVSTKRGLSTVVKNSLIEAGAVEKKTAVTYRIIKGGDNGDKK